MKYKELMELLKYNIQPLLPDFKVKVKDGISFCKKSNDVMLELVVTYVNYSPLYITTFFIATEAAAIRNIISHYVKSKNTSRVTGAILFYRSSDYEDSRKYKIMEEKDLDGFYKSISDFVTTNGTTLFQLTKLKDIEHYFNENVDCQLTFQKDYKSRAVAGILLAKIFDNPKLESLIEQYRNRLNIWETEQCQFDDYVKFVMEHSAEELLELGKTEFVEPPDGRRRIKL
jgi:hypothetical protein